MSKKKTNLFIAGITGRMGQHILEIANQDAKLNVTGGLGKGSLAGAKVLKSFPAKSGSIDVVIDFTLPTFFSKTLS